MSDWCVHLEGPDDMIPMPSRSVARRTAEELNTIFATWPQTEHSPTIHAVAMETRDEPEADVEERSGSEAERLLTGLSREAAGAAEKCTEVATVATRDAAKANRYAEALGGALEYFRKANAE